jgi:hypothetical protein
MTRFERPTDNERTIGLQEVAGTLLILGSSWLLWKALRSDNDSAQEPAYQPVREGSFASQMERRRADFLAVIHGEMPASEYVRNQFEEHGLEDRAAANLPS